MAIGEALAALGQTLAGYGQYQYQKKRADQDDAFEAERIRQANEQIAAAEQNRLRDESSAAAQQTSRSLENAGIYGAGPALSTIAATQGNRVQGQTGVGGAMQDYAGEALGALKQASDTGLPENQVTDLGDGRYFVPPDLGKPERVNPYGPDWLAAQMALIAARGDQNRKTQAARPPSLSAQNTATNLSDRMLGQDVDRYTAEAGGDPNKAMTRYFQQKGMGSAATPEEAQQMSDLATRFNSAGQKYRNSTVTGMAGGQAVVKGKIPLSAVSKATRRQWAGEAGVPPTNDPANVAKMLEWIKANHPEVDVTLR